MSGWDAFWTTFGQADNPLGAGFWAIWDSAIIDTVKTLINMFGNWIEDSVNSKIEGIENIIGAIPLVDKPYFGRIELPELAAGGFIPKSTVAQLHAGEYVLTSNQVRSLSQGRGPLSTTLPTGNGGPGHQITIIIDQPTVSDDVQLEQMADLISERIKDVLEQGGN